MIRPEQLADALQRLEPRDRELLSLSLHRRVPDEALARMYDYEPAEVSRRRAAAIERLADDLRVERGEDLGSVLKALLEPDTWSGIEPAPGREFEAEPQPAPPPPMAAEAGGSGEPMPPPVPLRPVPASPAPQPEPEPSPPPLSAVKEPEPEPESEEPVLDMLSGGRGGEGPGRRVRAGALTLAALGAAALVGAAGIMAATQLSGGDDSGGTRAAEDDGTRNFVPAKGGPLEAPFASDPETSNCYSTAYVDQSTVLFREPGGEPRLRITRETEWGSPRVLGVVGQRGDWLGVQASELKNGEVAWIPRERARVDCVRWSLHADLSKRELFVRRDGHTVRKFEIAVGSPGHTTPLGRFSVTDKLNVTDKDSPYGCCVLALTGHQTDLPEDWPGGDRLAVHATTDVESIGKAVSLGCMRVRSEEARWLIVRMPLGAPVFVRS
ncbi:MAG: L,D-transpeptidase [Thermoleophilaceae bacterium]|nr:L,D-transpeptidase [Thermoleophilaceae bacterium]